MVISYEIVVFLLQAVALSLAGVLSPGPVAAAALAIGANRRHAGAWIAVGHGIVEFPLMLLIVLGVETIWNNRAFHVVVGLAGGAALLVMGGMMLADLRRPAEYTASPRTGNPLWTGVVLTAGNPFFLVWWATAGLNLTKEVYRLGVLAFAVFALVHWMCDLVWLEALSQASHRGVKLLGPRSVKVVLAVCGTTMIGFAIYFAYNGVKALSR